MSAPNSQQLESQLFEEYQHGKGFTIIVIVGIVLGSLLIGGILTYAVVAFFNFLYDLIINLINL